MAKGKKTGGRKRGTPNNTTREIREVTQALFDNQYWALTRQRVLDGKVAPAIESKLLAYAYGEPRQTIDVPQLSEMAAALARKVVHELHPGPTKSPTT